MVIGIIAVLSGIVLVAVNPGRQFKLARDSQRMANVNAILNAIGQNIAENKGQFKCGSAVTSIPSFGKTIKAPAGVDGMDIRPCIVPVYISEIPLDPTTGSFTEEDEYNTGYVIYQDSNGRITASSTGEVTPSISVTR